MKAKLKWEYLFLVEAWNIKMHNSLDGGQGEEGEVCLDSRIPSGYSSRIYKQKPLLFFFFGRPPLSLIHPHLFKTLPSLHSLPSPTNHPQSLDLVRGWSPSQYPPPPMTWWLCPLSPPSPSTLGWRRRCACEPLASRDDKFVQSISLIIIKMVGGGGGHLDDAWRRPSWMFWVFLSCGLSNNR